MTRRRFAIAFTVVLWAVGFYVLGYRKLGSSGSSPGSISPPRAAAAEEPRAWATPVASPVELMPGDLVKDSRRPKIYYVTDTHTRRVFVDAAAYASWHESEGAVKSASYAELERYPVTGTVTMRPGWALVRIDGEKEVYAVARGDVLRWIKDPGVAAALYGPQLAEHIVVIPRESRQWYRIGEPISDPKEYNREAELAAVPTIAASQAIKSPVTAPVPPAPEIAKPFPLRAGERVDMDGGHDGQLMRVSLANLKPFTSQCIAKNRRTKSMHWEYGYRCGAVIPDVRLHREVMVVGWDDKGVLVRFLKVRNPLYPILCAKPDEWEECPTGGLAFMDRALIEKKVADGLAKAKQDRIKRDRVRNLLKQFNGRKH